MKGVKVTPSFLSFSVSKRKVRSQTNLNIPSSKIVKERLKQKEKKQGKTHKLKTAQPGIYAPSSGSNPI